MKSKENLVFLGMMGSGKSSIGLIVAKKLGLNFIDIDKEIEKELGIDIKKIFTTKGETYFRKFEEKITLKKLKFNSTVISLGGGAFINNNVRKEILKNHISFWLNWDNEILLNRIKNSKKRPLVSNSTNNELIDLIKKRSNIYSKALYEIKCDNLSKNEIVKRILEIYEAHKIKN
jgi:shikimate kinase